MPITRRMFLKGSLLTSAAAALPLVVTSRALGAADEIRVGVVGLGGRGVQTHVPRMQNQSGVRVVAVCDPDRRRMGRCAEEFEKKYGLKVDQYVDMRRLLDRQDIDVISNATQNYWHGLLTIRACQAGKHVYVEKPLSHYIWEGRQMVNAARTYDRIVETGTQRRSQRSVIEAIRWVRAGNLGGIQYITAFANKPRGPIGKRATPLPIPDHVDYDLWCGPAKKRPLYRDRLHYDCSFVWNTGDGESCNQGVHEIDMACWCLGVTELPRRVMSLGGRFLWDDVADVPNTQIVYYDFPQAPILYEVHNMTAARGSKEMPAFRGRRTGICVQCEGGHVNIPAGRAYDADGKCIKTFSGGEDHFENFIAAVRNGSRDGLRAEVADGHLSTAICHTGNISYRLGRKAARKDVLKQAEGVKGWEEMVDRLMAYLKGWDIDLAAATITLGPWLAVDPKTETFQANPAANALARGWYREPYLVPDLS
ncbi:MAG: Gfo/Idh/MocA family oxidoreductase [Planctomycetota bacterium]|nr:Gfo/Idh/MocA family oxidoreductase [Planctomycetota bacterium]